MMEETGKRVVILGGGVAGCTAALMAAEAGFLTVLVESRGFLGYEINGRYQMFMDTEGWEAYQSKGILRLDGKLCGEEICFFQGQMKTALMKQITEAGIPCLFFSHLAGIVCEQEKGLAGIVLANSYGTWYLPADFVLDCTADGVLRRMCEGKGVCAGKRHAAWVMELEGLQTQDKILHIQRDGEWETTAKVHSSRRSKKTVLVEFEMLPEEETEDRFGRTRLENAIRYQAAQILSGLRNIFYDQTIHLVNMSSEAAVWAETEEINPECAVRGCFEDPRPVPFPFHASDLLQTQEEIRELIQRFRASADSGAFCPADSDRFLYRNGEKEKLTDEIWKIDERPYMVWGTAIWPVKLTWDGIAKLHVPVVVVGLGTAGMSALQGLEETDNIGVEAQYVLGGTRTAGHVINYYYGRIGGYTEELEEELLRFDRDILHTPVVHGKKCGYLSLAMMHHYKAWEESRTLMLGSVVFDVVMKEDRAAGIVVANEYGIFRIDADVIIDTTGNGDVAVLAHAEYEFGDPDNGICQTYSQWGVEESEPEDFYQRRYVGDYDMVDTSDYADLIRASVCAQLDNSPYYSSNPVSFREGRRIMGEDYLDLERAILNKDVKEPITVAVSTIDNHGRISADISRMGFCAVERAYKTAIPLGCFIPRGIKGMLVGGKAISVDRDTLSLVRMNADIQNAGYALGIVGKSMAGHPGERPDYGRIRTRLEQKDLLPEDFLQPGIPDVFTAIDKLDSRDAFSLRDVLLQDKREALPLLKQTYRTCSDTGKRLLLAKALAWFGDGEGRELLLDRMRWLERYGIMDANSDIDADSDSVRHGISGDLNDYWEMNQLIELMGRIGGADTTGLLCRIIQGSSAGGPPHVSRSPYYGTRRDMICVPCYERIYNLSYVFAKNPDPAAGAVLFELLKKEDIGGNYFAHTLNDKPLVLSSYLELSVAIAAYRCGAVEAGALIESYSHDVRSIFSKWARKELDCES